MSFRINAYVYKIMHVICHIEKFLLKNEGASSIKTHPYKEPTPTTMAITHNEHTEYDIKNKRTRTI